MRLRWFPKIPLDALFFLGADVYVVCDVGVVRNPLAAELDLHHRLRCRLLVKGHSVRSRPPTCWIVSTAINDLDLPANYRVWIAMEGRTHVQR